jgi:type I restriction enzyme S subunit
MSKINKIIPELRFPEFVKNEEWEYLNGNMLFEPISNKNHNSDLPILAVTQEQGAIPRELIDYHVTVSKKSIESYKVVEIGDFIISLRSFQGGIEYSNYLGLCSPAYIILRKKSDVENDFYRHYFKSYQLIQDLNRNLEGIRDGKMVSYKQFSEILIPMPKKSEQQKIASCISSLDELIAAHNDKLETLKNHKKGLMRNLFPQEGQKVPNYRFPEFENDSEWMKKKLGNEISYFKGFAFKSKDYTSIGRRIVRVSDMGFDYIKNEDKAIYLKEEEASQYKKWELQENDLIITTVGSKPPGYDSLVGRTIVVKSKDESSLLNQNAVCLRVNKNIEQVFFNSLFKRNEYINFFKSIIRGNAKQGSVTLENLFQYQVLVPKSTKYQNKIASCLSALDELITAQSEKIKQLQEHKNGLMQGLFPKIES